MLFGNLLQNERSEPHDDHLKIMAEQLKKNIARASLISASCKLTNYEPTEFQFDAEGQLQLPKYKQEVSYNEQFWKIYLKNQISFAIIKDLNQKTQLLEAKTIEIEALHEQFQKLEKIKNRKKHRRLAVQISKNYDCPYDRCYRIYGSQVSLNLHIKLKHNGGNKSDRQKLAKEICEAEAAGKPLPQMRFNLPKGFIEEFKKKYYNTNEASPDENDEPSG